MRRLPFWALSTVRLQKGGSVQQGDVKARVGLSIERLQGFSRSGYFLRGKIHSKLNAELLCIHQ